jgi:hypothetical protein
MSSYAVARFGLSARARRGHEVAPGASFPRLDHQSTALLPEKLPNATANSQQVIGCRTGPSALGFDWFPAAGRLNGPTTNFSRDEGFLVRCLLPRIRVSLGIASRGAAGRATAALVLLAASAHGVFAAQEDNAATEQKVLSVVPAVEDYIAANMKAFDVPGLAIGIVVGDKVVYAKGFGVRSKHGEPVDTHTVFQIGSTSKAFLATTMAIAVDHGKLHWDDRVVDLDPAFN